ncbi:hypothetical protein RAS2_25520 [Phycisphaerae bacterium RAS2]|nr:hypothetical protein RAS2_25520 [Phycisphaerae bacterium RAS2]
MVPAAILTCGKAYPILIMSPIAFVVSLACSLLAQTASSQPGDRDEDASPPVPARPAALIPGLEEPYIDGTFGFSIQPPPGWQVVPMRKQDKNELVLLRLVQILPDGRFSEISVRQTSLPQRQPMNDLLKQRASELELQFSNAKIHSQQVQPIAGRPGGSLTASYWRENREHLRVEALVDAGRRQCIRLIWVGPLELRADSEAMFARVVASFQLLRDQVTEQELRAALQAGQGWMESLTAKKLHAALLEDELLRITHSGKTIGFIRVQQVAEPFEKREGVRVRERGWTFEPDGRIRRIQNSTFLSDDLKYERWRTSITTLVPRRSDAPQTLEVVLEEGLRTDRYLLSNQCYDILAPAVENPSLTLPKTFLPRALVRMMPRLVDDPAKKQRLGFTYFDHRKADLVLRVVDFHGPVDSIPEGAVVTGSSRVFQIDEREGLASNPSELFVDDKGRTVLARVGKLTLTPTTAKEMEEMFLSRVTAAESAMTELEAQANEAMQGRFGRKP